MKAYPSLASFACALVIGAALPTGIALAGHPETPAFQAGAGVLSYSFFNLSGQSCTFTPYGAQPNYNTSGWSNWGWQNTGSDLAFFNNGNPEGNGGWIFYNNSDPINTDTSGTPPAFPAVIPLANGVGSGSNNTLTQVTSTETWQNWSINYPAMGDSWGVDCGPPASESYSAVATLASSGSSLQSGWYGSLVGSIPNANITPTGNSNPYNDGCSANNLNPCGADFAPQGLNWNLDSNNPLFQNMGGFWSGLSYLTYGGGVPASNSLNFAILPINFSAYVQANTGINFTDMSPNVQTYFTSIYGGHTAIAVGDPYLISSISAKILWFLATSPSFTLNNGTQMSNIASTLSSPGGPPGGTGVFWSNSYEDAYVQWFVGSQSSSFNYPGQPSAAAQAYYSAYKAASVPITSEKIWGKVFTGLADIAIDAAAAALYEIPGGVGEFVGGLADGASGSVKADVNSAITNAYTYSASGAPPNPTQAPPTFNGTFAATNLFGMLLSNMGVQSEINILTGNTGSPSPLWANYDINTDGKCISMGINTISVTNNLMQGECNCNQYGTMCTINGAGTLAPVDTYTNVYTPGTQTTKELSIWNAILSGSNITTNLSGYMITGGSNQYPAFSPPTVVVNASTSNFSPNSIVVNTAFNANTGFLTANSIGVASEPPGAQSTASATEPSYIPPPALQTNPTGTSPTIWTISIPTDGISYTSTGANAGAYTINTYCITNASNNIGTTNSSAPTCTTPANGAQTINMTNCLQDSLVTVGSSIANSSQTPPAINITLGCQPNPTPSGVTLNYGSCTNDKWASGGVYAAVTTPPNNTGTVGEVVLACACVPSYLDGPQASDASSANLLGGYVVGATSSSPSQQCPQPAT